MTEQMALDFEAQAGKAFSPTAPIDERSLFAGRIPQIQTLLRAVSQKGQHAILYGERGVGKTSLANVLSTFLVTDKVVAPRINCDGADSFESVWQKVFDEIQLSRTIHGIGFNTMPSQERADISRLLGDPITPESVRRALTFIAQSTALIVIIDEFDRLNPGVKLQLADTIKTLSDHAVDITVILVGVADSVSELIQKHESVERALVQVQMPRMSPIEIQQIIESGLSKLGLGISSEALEIVVELAQGLPHYGHLLGLHASEIAHQSRRQTIHTDIVKQAIDVSINSAQQSIKQAWHTATLSPRKDNLFAEVLIACARAPKDDLGYFAAQDVRDPLREILSRAIQIANYAQHLADFCDTKKGPVLQRKGERRKYRFRFANPLLQPYVVMKGYATGRLSDFRSRSMQEREP
jgi:Cdc6-like AAA superfamily ATPase